MSCKTIMKPVSTNVEHVGADMTKPSEAGWPQFVTMPEDGFEEVHRDAADIGFARNGARDLAKRLNKPVILFVGIEKYMPDGSVTVAGGSDCES